MLNRRSPARRYASRKGKVLRLAKGVTRSRIMGRNGLAEIIRLSLTPTAKRNSYRVAILVGQLPRVAGHPSELPGVRTSHNGLTIHDPSVRTIHNGLTIQDPGVRTSHNGLTIHYPGV